MRRVITSVTLSPDILDQLKARQADEARVAGREPSISSLIERILIAAFRDRKEAR